MMTELNPLSTTFCAHSDPANYTDLVSNLVVLKGLVPNTHYSHMVQGQIPDEFFFDAVHELTHHWCFHSPLGSSLALLRLKALTKIVTAKNQLEFFEEEVRFRTAMKLLRPLAEVQKELPPRVANAHEVHVGGRCETLVVNFLGIGHFSLAPALLSEYLKEFLRRHAGSVH